MLRIPFASYSIAFLLSVFPSLSEAQEVGNGLSDLGAPDWDHHVVLQFHGGGLNPTGDYGGYFNTGGGGGALIGFGISHNLVVSMAGAYYHFEGNSTVIPVTLNADYRIPSPGLCVGIGLGLYHVEEKGLRPYGNPGSENSLGFNAGFGILRPVARAVGVGASIRFHYAHTTRVYSEPAFFALQLDAGFGL